MLMLMLPLVGSLILPLMKINWSYSVYYLMVCSLAALMYMPDDSMLVPISNWFSIDSMSVLMAALSSFITAITILATHSVFTDEDESMTYMFLLLILNLISTLSFLVSKIIIFYILFEASLIPMMLVFLIWGLYPERMQAVYYMMVYTVLGSLPTLIAILYIMNEYSIEDFFMFEYVEDVQINPFLWIMLMMAFLVKMPMYSLHLWLPKAHVYGPLAVSLMLAGVLMKMGCYGYIRMATITPEMTDFMAPYVSTLALLGSVITGIMCLRSIDMKMLVAYSSVSHVGLFLAASSTLTTWGMNGSLMMMVAHTLTTSALFILVDINYNMFGSRSTILSKGMLTYAPFISLLWFLFLAMNMSAPPSINLLGEILMITAISIKYPSLMVLLGLIVITTAAYCLSLYVSINHGHPSTFMKLHPLIPYPSMFALMFLLLTSMLIILKPNALMF